MLTGFAALALLLAAAGLYGVLSTIASQYRREIGVRMALGAAWLDILKLVVMRGLVVSAIGVAVGLVGVLGGAQAAAGIPVQRDADGSDRDWRRGDPDAAIAAIACYIPARRAAGRTRCEALRVD